MKVSELIKYLEELPQDAIVIMSKDSEGNAFSPWSGDHSEGFYVPEGMWGGEFVELEWASFDPDDDDYYDPDNYKVYVDKEKAQECIVLWPIN